MKDDIIIEMRKLTISNKHSKYKPKNFISMKGLWQFTKDLVPNMLEQSDQVPPKVLVLEIT